MEPGRRLEIGRYSESKGICRAYMKLNKEGVLGCCRVEFRVQ